jgi:hypothetical protein
MSSKDEEARKASEDKARLQRRLNNLERCVRVCMSVFLAAAAGSRQIF